MTKSSVKSGRVIWTFVPTKESQSLIAKAITRVCGKAATDAQKHGVRTRLINEALILQHANLRGKREGGAA